MNMTYLDLVHFANDAADDADVHSSDGGAGCTPDQCSSTSLNRNERHNNKNNNKHNGNGHSKTNITEANPSMKIIYALQLIKHRVPVNALCI